MALEGWSGCGPRADAFVVFGPNAAPTILSRTPAGSAMDQGAGVDGETSSVGDVGHQSIQFRLQRRAVLA